MSGVLNWATRLLDTSSTVTGMDSPSSVKMRVMPTLRPTSPSRQAAGVGVEFDIVFSGGCFPHSFHSRLRLAGARVLHHCTARLCRRCNAQQKSPIQTAKL